MLNFFKKKAAPFTKPVSDAFQKPPSPHPNTPTNTSPDEKNEENTVNQDEIVENKTVDDSDKGITEDMAPETDDIVVEETEETDEWFENNHIPDDLQKVEEVNDLDKVDIPEDDKEGWYDPKTLVDIDENTSEEEIEEIDENTDNDLLENSELPEQEEVGDREPQGTPVVTIVNTEDEVHNSLNNIPVYLIDLSEYRYGHNLIPESSTPRSVPLDKDTGYEVIFDFPRIISENKEDKEHVAIFIVGLDEIINRAGDLLDDESISKDIILDRVRDLLDQAKDNNITVVIAPTRSDNPVLSKIVKELDV